MPPGKVETLRRGYDAFNHGDLGPVREMVTADVEWGTTRTFPGMQGVYRGARGIDEWMHVLRSVWACFDVSVVEIVGETEYALVVWEQLRGRTREDGVEDGIGGFAVYWFDAGRVRRRRAFTNRKEALEAAGLREGRSAAET
jgi:ketosteroid isomerase-like protein